jgi:nitroimidazol reductase NimA-like FMN-containing flavoprotein (pyridoxamine 5'-phosphate oxidase superfamily)
MGVARPLEDPPMPGPSAAPGNPGFPRVDRPEIPAEYGIAKATDTVEWSHVEERLNADRVYWIATVGPTARPRVRPVDGMYLDGVIYVGGELSARWIRELGANPHVSIHLDGTDDVVIVDGEARILDGLDDEHAEKLAAVSQRKFPEYGMTAASFRGPGPIAITPRKVIAWTNFMRDPTRFTFD